MKIFLDLEVENSELKKRLKIPRGDYMQLKELAQVEKENSALTDTLARERDENAETIEELATLRQRFTDLQAKWDTHVCVTPTLDLADATSTYLTKALSDLQVSEK